LQRAQFRTKVPTTKVKEAHINWASYVKKLNAKVFDHLMYGVSKWILVKLLRETSSPRASCDETWSSKRAQRLSAYVSFPRG